MPLAGVDAVVVDEVANSGESLPAGLARVGPLPRVRPSVDYHVRLLGELFATPFEVALEPLRALGLEV